MTYSFWTIVTHLGNATLLLPAALVLAFWLLSAGQWRRALLWALCFGAAVLLVLGSKLAFLGWGVGSAALDFTGISGHATLATAVIMLGAWLPVAHLRHRVQGVVVAAGFGVGVLVGVSRLVLQVHSVSEVVAGCALGALVTLAPIMAGRVVLQPLRHRWLPMAMAGMVLLTPQVGQPAEAHGLVVRMALAASGRAAVHDRAMLHLPSARLLRQPFATP